MASYADRATGRDCRPTNERLVIDAGASLSTIQRARRVLKALGLVVELVAGRSIMTREERLEAWRRGSSHRRIAAEFALCSPRRQYRVVEHDTPPRAPKERFISHLRSTHLQAGTETTKAASRPAHNQEGASGRRRSLEPRRRALVEAVRARLSWLRDVSPHRLSPVLHRFALAGWTARDFERAVADALATRGWQLPRQLTQPAAYFAALMRPLDPADRPGAFDEWMASQEAALRRYERELATGAPCPHGRPAGDVPSPSTRVLACPLCRAHGEQQDVLV